MAFNGSGVFVRLYNWVNDAAANIKIRADRMDAEMDGMATGLSTCITKNGQTTITANLPMAGFKHTGVGDATVRASYASAGQVQDGLINWVAAGGTADAITASYAISYTALVDGMVCYVRAASANATTTPTFAPSGLTAHTITKSGGSALVAGDIIGAGHELVLRYNLANTRWELLNPNVSIAAGSIALTKLATQGADTFLANATSGAASPTAIALAASQLAGKGSTGNIAAISVASGLSFSGATLNGPVATTRQYLTSGSAVTYTTPTGCRFIRVHMWGGGGGGAAAATNAGSAGSDSIFNSIHATAGGGGNVPAAAKGATPGIGGSGGTGSATFRMRGAPGEAGHGSATGTPGGNGGASMLGGNGNSVLDSAGAAAVANSGSGGAGGASGSNNGGTGGGAGEYVIIDIATPSATYTYTIGAGGNGGAAGTNAGGNGGSGMIIVEEYY